MTEFFEWRDAPEAEYAVLGDPVSHSLSPRMQNAALATLREQGYDRSYVAIRVPAGELEHALLHLRGGPLLGANVTLPLKEEAFAWSVGGDEFGQRVGAVNTLDLGSREGINTDGPGFLRSLALLNLPPACRTLVLGAGGSARTILAALSDAGHGVAVWNRTPERVQRVLSDDRLWGDAQRPTLVEQPWTEGFDLVVNATSAGTKGECPPVVWSDGRGGCTAYDLMYGDEPTSFLQQAASHGWRIVDGKEMLLQQGALSFEWWFENLIPAPIDVMRKAIE